MKKVFLALAFGTLLSTAHAAYTESNVTIQIKLHQQQPEAPEKNGVVTQVYKTFTLKTADVISILRKEIDDPARQWTKKARIIFLGDPSAIFQTGYYIREKGMEDYFLGDRLSTWTGNHVSSLNGRRTAVTKKKIVAAKNIHTQQSRSFSIFTLRPDGNTKELEITGIQADNVRFAKVKGDNNTFSIYTMSLTGSGTFDLNEHTIPSPFHGVAEGSFKISPPKILMHPPQPAGS